VRCASARRRHRATLAYEQMTSSIKPEMHNVSLRHQRRQSHCYRQHAQNFGEDRTCTSEDMIADTRTHTHRHAHYNTPLPYQDGVIIISWKKATVETTGVRQWTRLHSRTVGLCHHGWAEGSVQLSCSQIQQVRGHKSGKAAAPQWRPSPYKPMTCILHFPPHSFFPSP